MIAEQRENEFKNLINCTTNNNISVILKSIKENGGLTKEQTFLLFEDYIQQKKNGAALEDCVSRTILIIAYDKFINYVLSKMNVYDDDNYSIGKLGLIKAIDTFDINKGIQFMSYASHCIKNEVLMNFRKESSNGIFRNKVVSIDDAVNENDEHFSLYQVLKSDEDISQEVADKDEIEGIKELFKYLSPLEQYCFMAYLGIYHEPIKQNVIAKRANISQSYVSRLLVSVVKKLKLLTSYFYMNDKSNNAILKWNTYPILTKEQFDSFTKTDNDGLITKSINDAKILKTLQNETKVCNAKPQIVTKEESSNSKIDVRSYLRCKPTNKKECYIYMLPFLRPLEQICIIYRYGLYGKQLLTCAEIAKKINWKKELLQPIYKNALCKMDLFVKNLDDMSDFEKKKFKDITKQRYEVISKDSYLKYGKNGKNCLSL